MHVSKVYQYPVDSYGDVRTLVRGLPYQCPDDWEDILDSLDEDSNLYLIKEPDNPKDELAIAAYLDDRRVGYVAASDNRKIWLYMTDEKMPCQFIERFDASFKIAFENPRFLFNDISFEEIYKDNKGLLERNNPSFKIPFLTNPKDRSHEWFDDRTYIADLDWLIPDFRRKLAARLIILVGRKNSKGEYCYYLPYINEFIAYIDDALIQNLIDIHGFVIALPDVPTMTHQGTIFMDLHVTYMKNTDYKDFNLANQSELVFNLTKDYDVNAQKVTDDQSVVDGDALFKQALEEEMNFIEETVYSDADDDLGAEIVKVVNDYLSGESPAPYQVRVIPQGGTVLYKSLEGKEIAKSINDEILELVEENRDSLGYITYVDYDDHDGDILVYRVKIRVYRSIPKVTIEQGSKASASSTEFNTNLPTAISDFFPIWGITLGETTWKQAEEMGHVVNIWKEGPSRYVDIGGITVWDFAGKGKFTSINWYKDNDDFPPFWKFKGFSWDNSYDQWMDVFKKLGFNVIITQQPSQKEFSGRNTLSAEFEALSSDGTLQFTMFFEYGENGSHTSSPKTLNSIDVEYKGSVTTGTSQVNPNMNEKEPIRKNQNEENYEVSDSLKGEKHVSKVDVSNRTKSITLKHPFSFEGVSMAELLKLKNMLKELMQHRSISCYALKRGGTINVYLEDGTLFHTVVDGEENETLNRILLNEKLLYGEISGHSKINTDKCLLIKLYYDFISGNHDDIDITILWMRDFAAQLHGVDVPKAKYVGKGSKADDLEKESVDIDFPCYEDDGFDSFDFTKYNFTHDELNNEIIRVTDLHQEDLYHNTPFVVLARQNPALPSLYELCLPDGSMFGIVGNEDEEGRKLRRWISEVGIVPVTVQSYKRTKSGCLELNYRAFKKNQRNKKVEDFVSAHFIDDIVDIEIEDEVFEKIVRIIDPLRNHSMTNGLTVVALIPNWASQAGYYIVKDDERIWLAPSFNADILDQVHQNNWTAGRVISYRNNCDGTYHFELKFHVEK